jgi:hypothetical protein
MSWDPVDPKDKPFAAILQGEADLLKDKGIKNYTILPTIWKGDAYRLICQGKAKG